LFTNCSESTDTSHPSCSNLGFSELHKPQLSILVIKWLICFLPNQRCDHNNYLQQSSTKTPSLHDVHHALPTTQGTMLFKNHDMFFHSLIDLLDSKYRF
jgi:hypothetical protein